MSIIKRVIVSSVGNLTRAIASFSSGLLIARGLEPSDYGVFVFLLSSFSALRLILDMGTSQAFFSFISKKQQPYFHYKVYLCWVFIQIIISILLISIIAPDEWILTIWRGEERYMVLLAFLTVFLQQQVWEIISQIAESNRETRKIQILNIGIAFSHFSLILTFYILDKLSVSICFILIIIEVLIALIFARFYLSFLFLNKETSLKKILIEYKEFCLPLIPYAWVSTIMVFLDTWLLQVFGGSLEQAYFGIGTQFSAISLLAAKSLLMILWKELAEASNLKNKVKIKNIFENTISLMFLITSFIAGLLIPWSKEVTLLLVGEKYVEGYYVIILMFFYPIYQSVGQLIGTAYLSLEMTKSYVVIGVISMTISIILTCYFLFPKDYIVHGLNLGSFGIALKLVLMGILTLNIQLWWISKINNWEINYLSQILCIPVNIIIGYLCYLITTNIFNEDLNFIIKLIFSSFSYVIITIFLMIKFSFLFGIKREKINELIKNLKLSLK